MKTLRYIYFSLTACLLISCSTEPDTTLYTLSVTFTPDGAGTISPAADRPFEEGSTVSFQAIANEGYHFAYWTGDLDTTANPISITFDRDYTLTANFVTTKELFFLHENGVTIMCPYAEPGQKGVVDGTTYTAVDRRLLDQSSVDLSKVCTSPVTDLDRMFAGDTTFNDDISSWDVSNVTTMHRMFFDASSFDGDLSSWNVGKVSRMDGMFGGENFGAPVFNGDISGWDVSSVTRMTAMFRKSPNFNGDLSSWNVANVTNMERMFWNASSFNGDISTWNVGNVTDMSLMFSGATSFNVDIGSWDVGNVTDMSFMFDGAETFNQDLSSWCVEKITVEPDCFSCGSPLAEEYHPVWGTCP